MIPDPTAKDPLPGHPRVAYIAPLAEGRTNVTVGPYSYYDDPDGPEQFFTRNVLHHYDFLGDNLHIGPFCAIAAGARIIMNGATHALGGFSTFPFNIFGGEWADGFDPASLSPGFKGDTVIGPDVWIGTDAMILPGTRIGAGAIIGARAVVSGEVRPYSVTIGNPAKEAKRRFDDATVDALMEIAWWDWPIEKITGNLDAIRGADLAKLRAAA
ncbi:CatB-related O-acetyltransferase [Paracoccaceae bacterium GXU_MW_L88]